VSTTARSTNSIAFSVFMFFGLWVYRAEVVALTASAR
jgi:hypothetical protein